MDNTRLELGIGRDGQNVSMDQEYYGNYCVFGKPGSGKSALTKALSLQIHKSTRRNIVIIDPNGIGWDKVNLGNNSVDFPDWFDNLYVVKDFCFKLSDFTKGDFMSMGFDPSSNAGLLLYNIAKNYSLHHDMPEVFLEILQNLPIKDDHVDEFNRKYGDENWTLQSAVFPQTKQSILSRIDSYYDLFWNPAGDKRRLLDDVGKLVYEKNVVCFSLNLSEGELFKSIVYVGLILRKMRKAIEARLLKPVFFFDEADYYFYNLEDSSLPYSEASRIISEWATKFRRYAVVIYAISQRPKMINPNFVKSSHYKLIGKLDKDDAPGYAAQVKSLKFGLRSEFLLYDKNDNYRFFTPHDTSCSC